ncbi:MAG: pyruvate synthase [Chloroflexi bacterium]|nr:MAG: pyruvate synthase [Chloroflexota bacterium]RLC96124.1 MAG: pyruvate synthase [Chloroflexota bacterium]
MLELRLHGRGGQGAVTSAEMLALAAISEGKYALAFPSFGPERRGAPVQAFVRIDDKPIRIRAEITEPDVVVVLDAGLLSIVDVTSGLKKNGIVVVNTKSTPREMEPLLGDKWSVATVDANATALETIGVPIVNTTMLGAILKVTDMIKIDSLEEPLKHRFGARAGQNLEACKKAYDRTVVSRRKHT